MSGTQGRRNLPARTIDVIRDGVAPADLRDRGSRAVWGSLVSTAASAIQRGWSFADWAGELSRRTSTLGTQVRLRKGREIPPAAVEKRLRAAWDAAQQWVAAAPAPVTADDARSHARLVRDVLVTDPDAPLNDTERAVLAAACTIAERNGTTRPAMPRREVAELAGVTEKAARCALERLDRRRLLRLDVPGRRGAPGAGKARAALYRLPDDPETYLSRVPRPMGPSAQTYGPQPESPIGPAAQTYGPLSTPTIGDAVTLDGLAQEKLDAARRAVEELGHAVLAQALREAADATADSPATDNVVPLRRAAGGAA